MKWTQETLDSYYRDGGDQRFRLDHYQDPNLIVEIGACDGDFTEKLSDKFPNALIIAVEPLPNLFVAAQKRLQGRANVALTNVGLWTDDGECKMTEEGAASAISSEGVPVIMKGIAPWIAEFQKIDLLIMNVEGAEYTLLGQMLLHHLFNHIENLQIQFHEVDADSSTLMLHLQHHLFRSHYPSYMYPFCMENWRIR